MEGRAFAEIAGAIQVLPVQKIAAREMIKFTRWNTLTRNRVVDDKLGSGGSRRRPDTVAEMSPDTDCWNIKVGSEIEIEPKTLCC